MSGVCTLCCLHPAYAVPPEAHAAPSPYVSSRSLVTAIMTAGIVCLIAAVAEMERAVLGPLQHRDLAPHLAAGRYVNYHGMAMFWREWASGTSDCVLLALHGFPTSSVDWAPLFDASRWKGEAPPSLRDCAIWSPDFIGFGASDKPGPEEWGYRLTHQADAVLHGLTELVRGRIDAGNATTPLLVHVLAHDYGTSVAQELLARTLDSGSAILRLGRDGEFTVRIASIALLNGGILPGHHRPLLVQRLLAHRFIGPLISPLLLNRWTYRMSLGRVFHPSSPLSPAAADAAWAMFRFKGGSRRGIVTALLSYMVQRMERKVRWSEALMLAPVPIAVINGPADPVSGAHVVSAYEQLRETWLRSVDGALQETMEPQVRAIRQHRDGVYVLAAHVAHYPQWDDPSGVLEALRRWDERQSP